MFIIDETSIMKLMTWAMYCMIAFQVIGFLIVCYVPFGFDHRSSWGLDFGHFVQWVYLIGLALCVGFGLSIATKHYFLAKIQALPTLVFVLFLLLGCF